jgi:hypothetical protein
LLKNRNITDTNICPSTGILTFESPKLKSWNFFLLAGNDLEKMLNYYKLVRLSGFAWDFYFSSVSMSLYLSVSLCISLYLSLSLPSISPKPNLTLNKPADLPSHRPTPLSLSPPPPLSHLLPLSLTSSLSLCRIFLLLKLIFGWTNSLII